MNKYRVLCTTDWCGMDAEYGIEANSIIEAEEIAHQLAYDNWESYGCFDLHAEDLEYDPEDMSEEDCDAVWEDVKENPSYDYYVEEFDGDDTEWNEISQ